MNIKLQYEHNKWHITYLSHINYKRKRDTGLRSFSNIYHANCKYENVSNTKRI